MALCGPPSTPGCSGAELERERLERDSAQNCSSDPEDGEQDFGAAALESGTVDAGSASILLAFVSGFL